MGRWLYHAVSLDFKGGLSYHPEAILRFLLFLNFCVISKQLRINRQIRVPEVRLIDEDENQLGVKSLEEALQIASEHGLDLVEVAPKVVPPVCKILDYGKYLYRQNKIEQKHKKMQKQGEMKGIRISYSIDKHDLETKIRQAGEFLKSRNSVKVMLVFKGRESSHSAIGKEKLMKFVEALKDVGQIEEIPKQQGNTMFMVLVPLK